MFSKIKFLTLASVCALNLAFLANAYAVGGGIAFGVHEGLIKDALPNPFEADSLDFTYHACSQVTDNGYLIETGYFWASSYQDDVGVVDSQLNYFDVNGYHIYGIYTFKAKQLGVHVDFLNPRVDYISNSGNIQLFVDPDQNTVLDVANCQVVVTNNAHDHLIGVSATLERGEKSEKVDIANGDFELRFTNWDWVIPRPILPFDSKHFIFNANVTRLNGPLNGLHYPEGSGNFYWTVD